MDLGESKMKPEENNQRAKPEENIQRDKYAKINKNNVIRFLINQVFFRTTLKQLPYYIKKIFRSKL